MELGSAGDFNIFSGGSEKFSLIRCYLSNDLKKAREPRLIEARAA